MIVLFGCLLRIVTFGFGGAAEIVVSFLAIIFGANLRTVRLIIFV
jgi:hypothetical protein